MPELKVERLQISLSELKLETHHRGCFVTAKTITSSHQFAEIVTIVEDENGNVARLVIGFQDDSLSTSGPMFPINSTGLIKEPYCKFTGEDNYVIRVDHPFDIAVLRGDDPALVLIMQFVAEGKEVTALQLKSARDKAYLERRYSSAIEWLASIWLTEQYRSLRNPTKTLKYTFEVLRNFGFVNAARDGNLELDHNKGMSIVRALTCCVVRRRRILLLEKWS